MSSYAPGGEKGKPPTAAQKETGDLTFKAMPTVRFKDSDVPAIVLPRKAETLAKQ